MRVESPFSEKSLAQSILTRARGLGILTFDKIEKKENTLHNKQIKTKMLELLSFCQNETGIKKTISKIFLWSNSDVGIRACHNCCFDIELAEKLYTIINIRRENC